MKFQTRNMTAMDIWLLKCMLFVALATFEYAMLLAMRFGTHLISASEKSKDAFRRCVKIDRLSLKIFFLAYFLSLGTYFYYVGSQYHKAFLPAALAEAGIELT